MPLVLAVLAIILAFACGVMVGMVATYLIVRSEDAALRALKRQSGRLDD